MHLFSTVGSCRVMNLLELLSVEISCELYTKNRNVSVGDFIDTSSGDWTLQQSCSCLEDVVDRYIVLLHLVIK